MDTVPREGNVGGWESHTMEDFHDWSLEEESREVSKKREVVYKVSSSMSAPREKRGQARRKKKK